MKRYYSKFEDYRDKLCELAPTMTRAELIGALPLAPNTIDKWLLRLGISAKKFVRTYSPPVSMETRVKHSKAMKGRTYSLETRLKISKTRRERMAAGLIKLSHRAGCGKGGFREDVEHYVRSTYEHAFALFLKGKNIHYQYEPKTFQVVVNGVSECFTPDFLVNGKWIEIKNSYNVKDKKFLGRLEAFKTGFPEEKIEIVIGSPHIEDYVSLVDL